MGVYIKGKSKPDKCAYCAMGQYYYENGRLWCNAENKIVAEIPYEDRLLDSPLTNIDIPSWCPLVEVAEPHGRLIDAEYLEEHLYQCETNGRPLHIMDLNERLACITDVPTIIEAEDEPQTDCAWK